MFLFPFSIVSLQTGAKLVGFIIKHKPAVEPHLTVNGGMAVMLVVVGSTPFQAKVLFKFLYSNILLANH